MNTTQTNERRKAKRLADLYNMVPNLLWSVLGFVPLVVFCYSHLPLNLLFIFMAISFVPLFFPNTFFEKIQLSKRTTSYKKLGIDLALRLSQNGAIVNRKIRKKVSWLQDAALGSTVTERASESNLCV